MGTFGFENLEVYQRALKFSVELCELASAFPFKYSRLRDQLIGAAISIPLNIAEGYGRGGRKEKANFYRTSKASAFECVSVLTLCLKLKILREQDYNRLRLEAEEISKMLSGLISATS